MVEDIRGRALGLIKDLETVPAGMSRQNINQITALIRALLEEPCDCRFTVGGVCLRCQSTGRSEPLSDHQRAALERFCEEVDGGSSPKADPEFTAKRLRDFGNGQASSL